MQIRREEETPRATPSSAAVREAKDAIRRNVSAQRSGITGVIDDDDDDDSINDGEERCM